MKGKGRRFSPRPSILEHMPWWCRKLRAKDGELLACKQERDTTQLRRSRYISAAVEPMVETVRPYVGPPPTRCLVAGMLAGLDTLSTAYITSCSISRTWHTAVALEIAMSCVQHKQAASSEFGAAENTKYTNCLGIWEYNTTWRSCAP